MLLIEDDHRIRASVADHLAELGHHVESEARAMPGVERAVSGDFDAVLLDLGLPDLDGVDALAMIRSVSEVPVIVATARDSESDIVGVLDAGADDYIVKPYGVAQLEARLRAVLRRAAPAADDQQLVVGDLVVDVAAHEARLEGRVIELNAREFELLRYLAEHAGAYVSKRELLAGVWRQPYGGADKTVDVHLSWLRRKLGETAAEPRYLQSKRGVGVRLRTPEQ